MTTTSRQSVLSTATIVLGTAVIALVTTPLVPALPALAAELGTNTVDGSFIAQMIMVAPAIMVIFGGPFAAYLSRYSSPRRAMLSLTAIFAAAGLFGLLPANIWLLFASRILVGISAGAISTLCLIQIANQYSADVRNRLFGWTSSVGALLGMGAIILGGALVNLFGSRGPFLLYAAGLILLAMMIGTTTSDDKPASKGPSDWQALKPVLSFYALLIFASIGIFILHVEGPFLLRKIGVTDASWIGSLIAVPALLSAAAAFFYGDIVRHINVRRLLVITLVTLGAGLALSALATDVVMLAMGFILIGTAGGFVAPICKTLILAPVAESARAFAAGLILSMIYLAQFITPFVLKFMTLLMGDGLGLMGMGLFLMLLGLGIAMSKGRLNHTA